MNDITLCTSPQKHVECADCKRNIQTFKPEGPVDVGFHAYTFEGDTCKHKLKESQDEEG